MASRLPARAAWTDEGFSFFDSNGVEQSKTCGEVGELAGLDYVYDDLVPTAPPPPPRSRRRSGRTAASSLGDPDRTRILRAAAGPSSACPRERLARATPGAAPIAQAAADPETPRVYLHLEDVDCEGAPGIVWEVRLDPDWSGGDPEEAVGAVTFFGRRRAHASDPAEQTPGMKGERSIFDITDIVSMLEATGPWDETRITVSFRPALPDGYTAERTPAARIGRVYVTHG